MSLGNDPRRVPDRGEPEPEDCRYCDRRTYNPKRVCSDCRHERGERLVPDGGAEKGRAIVQADTGPETGPRLDFEADREQTDRRELYLDGSLVLVGCGKSKRDPEDPADLHVASVGVDEPMTSLPGADTGPAWEARDLYTSSYFGVKAELADLVTTWAQGYDADPWAVLSAEHGVVPCSRNLKYYDTKISELGDDPSDPDDRVNNPFKRRRPDGQEIVTEMDAWAADVAASLCRWVASFRDEHAKPWENDAQELIVLAGQDYIQPLRERGVFEYGISRMTGDPNEGYTFPLEPRYLFEEIPAGGNGDQMGWMSSAIEELEPLVTGEPETEQDTLVTDGGQPAESGRGGPHGDDEATHAVCLACGQIKPHEYFPEGSTRCQKCIDKGLSDQYRPVGDGFELTEVSVDSYPDHQTADDCHEANGGDADGN